MVSEKNLRLRSHFQEVHSEEPLARQNIANTHFHSVTVSDILCCFHCLIETAPLHQMDMFAAVMCIISCTFSVVYPDIFGMFGKSAALTVVNHFM